MSYFTLFGRQIPFYGLLGVIGVLLGIVYLAFACKKLNKSFDDSVYIYVWACLAAMLGAKILYIIIEFGNILDLIRQYPDKLWNIISIYISGGFVFYGGLIGAILGVFLASKYFKVPVFEQFNLMAPVIPLVHGFGRIGCHIVGCCYGMEYDGPLSICYEASNYAPNGVGLFPVQMIEAIGDFVIFAVLISLVIAGKAQKYYMYIYLAAYSVMRFVLEFFRGDDYRGEVMGVSTSQIISIILWITLVTVFVVDKRKKATAK